MIEHFSQTQYNFGVVDSKPSFLISTKSDSIERAVLLLETANASLQHILSGCKTTLNRSATYSGKTASWRNLPEIYNNQPTADKHLIQFIRPGEITRHRISQGSSRLLSPGREWNMIFESELLPRLGISSPQACDVEILRAGSGVQRDGIDHRHLPNGSRLSGRHQHVNTTATSGRRCHWSFNQRLHRGSREGERSAVAEEKEQGTGVHQTKREAAGRHLCSGWKEQNMKEPRSAVKDPAADPMVTRFGQKIHQQPLLFQSNDSFSLSEMMSFYMNDG